MLYSIKNRKIGKEYIFKRIESGDIYFRIQGNNDFKQLNYKLGGQVTYFGDCYGAFCKKCFNWYVKNAYIKSK